MSAPTIVANGLRERDLQKQVRAMLTQFGWKTAVTWTSLHSPKGWPDLFAVRPVRGVDDEGEVGDYIELYTEAVAIELKSERGNVSPEQQAWLDDLARVPGVKFAGVIRPSNWYAGELDGLLR